MLATEESSDDEYNPEIEDTEEEEEDEEEENEEKREEEMIVEDKPADEMEGVLEPLNHVIFIIMFSWTCLSCTPCGNIVEQHYQSFLMCYFSVSIPGF